MGVEERVRQLIEESDLTHTEFGARIGLEKTKLSKSLAGRRRFTFLELALAAQQGGVTVDWLLTGTEDSFAAAARTGSDGVGASASLSRARELTNLREALEGFGFSQQIRFEAGDLKGNRWALQGIELAKRLRHSFHSPVEQAANLATLIETDLGVDVAIQPLGRLDGLAVTTGSARRSWQPPPSRPPVSDSPWPTRWGTWRPATTSSSTPTKTSTPVTGKARCGPTRSPRNC